MSWGKSDQDRFDVTLAYIRGLNSPSFNLFLDWLNVDTPYTLSHISQALSLGRSRFSRGGTSKSQRKAIRACMITRLAAESPRSLQAVRAWKPLFEAKTEAELQRLTRNYLRRLKNPRPLPPAGAVSLLPGAYGVSASEILAKKGSLSAPQAKTATTSATAAGPPPGPVASHAARKDFFEKISRQHVVLSGHGSWVQPLKFVKLKKHQTLRTYIGQYYPLGNDVGQLIDSRQFPVPLEEYTGGESVPDYTLQQRGDLRLLNNSVGDTTFVTVKTNTLLSTYINRPEFAAATFHWAACRVVFDNAGNLWCPNHNTWEAFNGACVLK